MPDESLTQKALATWDSVADTKSGKSKFRKDAHNQATEDQLSEDSVRFDDADVFPFDSGQSVSSVLLGSGRRSARHRTQIYQKWSFMEGDPIISTSIKLQCTAALGGNETNGDIVFIETRPEFENDKAKAEIVKDIGSRLSELFNTHAFTAAYNAAVFGDAYARVYSKPKEGVIDLAVNEYLRPPLVMPMEQGTRTVGFRVYTSKDYKIDLNMSQVARLKMPRTQWVPQTDITEKAYRVNLLEDDPFSESLPLIPATIGGSLLYEAEEPYDNLYASILGMVGQRWLNAIDEETLTIQTEGMTKDQRELTVKNLVKILAQSKSRADQAMGGMPVLEKIRNIIPISRDKQILGLAEGVSSRVQSPIQVDDVMFHARLLAGSLGTDLAMIGFADQLSGGLGEGGFFRVSAQTAERSRHIRTALVDFFNHIIDIHTFTKYGIVFKPSERPWLINFYGSISALEKERAQTKMEAMNAAGMLVQGMQMAKELGLSESSLSQLLTKEYLLDEDEAKQYATDLKASANEEGEQGQFGGGGMDDDGMEFGGDDDYVADEQPKQREDTDNGNEDE